jgi:FkbM family methyltransferase
MLMRIKKALRAFGYDIRRHHSVSEMVLRHYAIQTILDIGANDGYWSTEMRALFPKAQIYAFEPLQDCFNRSKERFVNDKKFHIFQVGLGDTEMEAPIERSSFHPSSSMLRMSALHKELYPKSADSNRETITLRRLDSFEKEITLEPDVLIKMDVQGFEDKVIAGGQNIIRKASVVIIETAFMPLYEAQPLFGDIHDLMRGLGFSYRGNCGEHFSSKTGERIYEDSVFVRQKP